MKRQVLVLIFLIIASILCFGCSNSRKREVVHSIRKFNGKTVLIVDSVYYDKNGRFFTRNSNEYLIVSYYDTDICSECTIDGLLKWQKELDSIFNSSFAPLFLLFHSPLDVFSEIVSHLSKNGFRYPIYYDPEGYFIKDNPCIPEDHFLHTFLIDENNKVILSGIPIKNERLWQLYVQTIMDKEKNE
jgi:hypothetical protein